MTTPEGIPVPIDHRTDPTLAIESVMDETLRDAILTRFPDMRGATVADLLDIMCAADYGLEHTEPAWESWGDNVVDLIVQAHGLDEITARGLVTHSMLAYVLAGETLTESGVGDLAAHAAGRS